MQLHCTEVDTGVINSVAKQRHLCEESQCAHTVLYIVH